VSRPSCNHPGSTPSTGGITSARRGMRWEIRSTRAAARTTANDATIHKMGWPSKDIGTAPEQQLPDAAPICTTGWWGMTGVQTGWDSRLCAGAALVIGCQTFGFGGHAATETGTIVPVCGRWQNAAVLTKFRTSQCGRGGSPCRRSSSSSVQKSMKAAIGSSRSSRSSV
jgi:hypothetical protein